MKRHYDFVQGSTCPVHAHSFRQVRWGCNEGVIWDAIARLQVAASQASRAGSVDAPPDAPSGGSQEAVDAVKWQQTIMQLVPLAWDLLQGLPPGRRAHICDRVFWEVTRGDQGQAGPLLLGDGHTAELEAARPYGTHKGHDAPRNEHATHGAT